MNASTGTLAVATDNRAAALLALALGMALIFVVGFANAVTLHNAAHDTRHTLAFPCH